MAKRTAKRTAKKPARRTATSRTKARTKTRAKAKPKAAKASKPRIPSAEKARSKSEVFRILAEQTGMNRKQVSEVFESMTEIIAADLSKRGPGVFNIPGMMKVSVVRKPATKARKGINPFTGEPTVFKAKPARNVVKIRPLKALKDLV